MENQETNPEMIPEPIRFTAEYVFNSLTGCTYSVTCHDEDAVSDDADPVAGAVILYVAYALRDRIFNSYRLARRAKRIGLRAVRFGIVYTFDPVKGSTFELSLPDDLQGEARKIAMRVRFAILLALKEVQRDDHEINGIETPEEA